MDQRSNIGRDGKPKSDWWKKTKAFFHELVDLKGGLDIEGTIVNIKNNRRMVGANAWLLMCSIMIASLGLDLNSPAVIIGAMLISPLMSPILGIGLGVGINDQKTIVSSLTSFGVAIGIALVTSTLYFFLTPFGEVTNEILGRTKPTLLDVLVATFGGIAGIISGSRKDQSNAIPGVAIATALMPPLCVTGYGIANGNWVFIANSFYLFFLNATFVALATLIIVRYLEFPRMKHNDLLENRRNRNFIAVISLIMMLPSMYILYQVLTENQQNRAIKSFVTTQFGNRLDDYKLEGHHLLLKIYGAASQIEDVDFYQAKLDSAGIKGIELDIISTTEVDLDKFTNLESQFTAANQDFHERMELAKTAQSTKDQEIEVLQMRLDSIQTDTIPIYGLGKEAKILFPNLKQIGFAKSITNDFKSGPRRVPTLLVKWSKRPSTSTKKKLETWVAEKFDLNEIELVSY